jgi:hypothetical protein
MRAGRVAGVGALVCGFALSVAPGAAASQGDLLSGSFNVVGPNTLIDTWTISQQCTEIAVGCAADVHSPLIDGQATYRGAHTWMMTLKGLVPVCPDKSKTKGAMLFVWNSQTLQGQLTAVQSGVCVMTRPGQDQIPFTLVPAPA